MRIDVFLAEKGLVNSRTEAKQLLKAGAVLVDGKPMTKPAFNVEGYEEKIIVDWIGYFNDYAKRICR